MLYGYLICLMAGEQLQFKIITVMSIFIIPFEITGSMKMKAMINNTIVAEINVFL